MMMMSQSSKALVNGTGYSRLSETAAIKALTPAVRINEVRRPNDVVDLAIALLIAGSQSLQGKPGREA